MTGRHTSRHVTTTLALSTALAVLCALGCSSSNRIAKANDALRIQREDLRERVETLEGENAELHVKIAEFMLTSETELSSEVLAAIPRVTSIELTRYCSVWTEGGASEARFFIVPKDGRGRFVHAVGSLRLSVMPIPQTDPDIMPDINQGQPVTIGNGTYGATEVRDAYTSGLSGSVYMIQLPLTEIPSDRVAFVISFSDAITGESHSDYRLVIP